MKRLAAIVVALTILTPDGDAVAAPVAAPVGISEPFAALRGAARLGNARPVDAPRTPDVPSTPTVPVTPPVVNVSVEMQAVLDLVNIERMARGLAPLSFSAQLNQAALLHTIEQAADGDIYHIDPDDGSGPGERIERTGYRFSRWGENVAAGHRTPREVMDGWMNSPGHCRNVLNPAFTELGVGYVEGGVTYGRFWTQAFARPAGVPQPAGVYNPTWC